MKIVDALTIGFQVLAAFKTAEKAGVPLPVNWSWKSGRKRRRLKGTVSSEDA